MPRKKSPTSEMKPSKQAKTPLAQRINSLITDANELKDYLDCTIQAVNQFRYGESRPSLENLCKIADFYNVSTDYLLGRTDEPSVSPDIQGACLTTGLSGESVEILNNLFTSKFGPVIIQLNGPPIEYTVIQLLDMLIKSNQFQEIFKEVGYYLENGQITRPNGDAPDMSELLKARATIEKMGYKVAKIKDIKEMHLQTATDLFKNVFREISEGGE